MRYFIVNTNIAFSAMLMPMSVLFKDWLKDIRRERDVSQEDLANATGISQTTISQWENGRNLPTPRNLRSVAGFFGVDYEAVAPLIGLPGKEVASAPLTDPERERLYNEIFQTLEGINLKGVLFLRDQARLMIKRNFPREPEEQGEGNGSGSEESSGGVV